MLTDIQKWQIEMLATNGGFSDRLIASYVFGIAFSRVREEQIRAVTAHRLRVRALLGNWRNGRTKEAMAHANRATAGGRKRSKSA